MGVDTHYPLSKNLQGVANMAYIDQATKKAITTALKKVVPKNWKVTYGIRNHSTFVMSIMQADIDFPKAFAHINHNQDLIMAREINIYQLDSSSYKYADPTVVKLMQDILATIKQAGNWFDKSDLMSDYHHTAFYINITIGKWNKPFINK